MTQLEIFTRAWELQHSEEFDQSHKIWLSLDAEGRKWHSAGEDAADNLSSDLDPEKVFKKYYK